MAFLTINPTDIEAGKPVDNDLMTQIKDNEDANNAATAGAINYDIPNGDMELTDGSFPANWDLTSYPGGAAGNGIATTSPINGSQSMKLVHPGGGGNGGGYADSEYIPCGEGAPFKLSWLHRSTVAGMKNQVLIRWFDKDKVFVSATTIYDSIINPTTTKQFSGIGNPISTARFYKVRLVGGESSVDVAGTALFDAVTVARLRVRTFTVSSGSSIDILDIRDSEKIRLTVSGLVWSATASLNFQVSTDNGATWNTSSIYSVASAHDVIGLNPGSTSAVITPNNTTLPVHGNVKLYNLGEALNKHYKTDFMYELAGGSTYTFYNKVGVVELATACNAIKILVSSGTFSAGKLTVEELL